MDCNALGRNITRSLRKTAYSESFVTLWNRSTRQ